VPSESDRKLAAKGTTLLPPEQRVEHIAAFCTLDLNTMNSGGQVVINTPGNVRRLAKVINAAGVKPEIELFDSGDIALMHDLLGEGTIKGPLLTSFVLRVKYSFQPGPETVLYARNLLPAEAQFTAIGVGRSSSPCHIWPEAMSASASRTASISPKESSHPRTRRWSKRRAESSRTWAAR
jgi:uncharacterized protein (DUF849 family)